MNEVPSVLAIMIMAVLLATSQKSHLVSKVALQWRDLKVIKPGSVKVKGVFSVDSDGLRIYKNDFNMP